APDRSRGGGPHRARESRRPACRPRGRARGLGSALPRGAATEPHLGEAADRPGTRPHLRGISPGVRSRHGRDARVREHRAARKAWKERKGGGACLPDGEIGELVLTAPSDERRSPYAPRNTACEPVATWTCGGMPGQGWKRWK